MSDTPHNPLSLSPSLEAGSARLGSMPTPFVCSFSRQGVGAAWVQASGELDLAGAPQLEAILRDAQSAARLVVLDLHHLAFIDTAGVHVIVDASLRALLAGRRLIVAFAPAHVEAILKLTATTEAVEMCALDETDAPASPHLRLVTA